MPFLHPKIHPALAFPGVGKRRVAGRSRGEADPLEMCIHSSRLRSWIKLRISCIPWRWGTREIIVGWQFQTWTIFSLYPPFLFFLQWRNEGPIEFESFAMVLWTHLWPPMPWTWTQTDRRQVCFSVILKPGSQHVLNQVTCPKKWIMIKSVQAK